MMHVDDIMSTVGCSVPRGDIIFCNLSTVGDTMIHVRTYHEYRGGTQITKDLLT